MPVFAPRSRATWIALASVMLFACAKGLESKKDRAQPHVPPGIVTESGTCHSAGCASVAVGALWGLPGGAVSWVTNDVVSPRVTVNGAVVSAAAAKMLIPALAVNV